MIWSNVTTTNGTTSSTTESTTNFHFKYDSNVLERRDKIPSITLLHMNF